MWVVLFGAGLIVSELNSNKKILVKDTNPDQEFTSAGGEGRAESYADSSFSLYSGDTLMTDSTMYAIILFLDQGVARVKPRSQLMVRGQMGRRELPSTRIDLGEGGVFLDVHTSRGHGFEVMTPTTIASVNDASFGAVSTGFYWVEVGEVEVKALQSGQSMSVISGMFAQISRDGSDILTGHLSKEQLDRLNEEYRIPTYNLGENVAFWRFEDMLGPIIEEERIESVEGDL